MSAEDIVGKVLSFAERAAPWESAFEKLIPLLETGALTPDQLSLAVEAVMLAAYRERIRSGR